jgi:glutamate---cysteine ligase / carboxylate-amine ligase
MTLQAAASAGTLPEWARWRAPPAPWTVGVEEEVMLVEDGTWALAARAPEVIAGLPQGLARHAGTETHASTLELQTGPHARVAEAIDELRGLRRTLAAELAPLGLRAAVAGTHPLADWHGSEVTAGSRHRKVHAAMRELARREPTFALHVHLAVPDAETTIRAMNALRRDAPLLLALSGNSPFWQGRDSGLASARTPIFGAFPRTGLPRRFGGYAEWAAAVDALVAAGAVPDHTHLWWDVRPQPALGTVETRIMDAQSELPAVGALAALVQCLVHAGAEGDGAADEPPEVLAENRFLALRDGTAAELVVTGRGWRPVAELVAERVACCASHAAALGCRDELAGVEALLAHPGAARQRAVAGGRADREALRGVVADLSRRFA